MDSKSPFPYSPPQDMKKQSSLEALLTVMATLRGPKGCPWDREQNHKTLRWHAVEEVYELMDAIDAGDDHEMEEELGDLLLQVVFHCQLAKERKAFDFNTVAARITEKLIRRHPHVFGKTKVKDVDQVWANWEKIKRAEKQGTKHDRASALDGIPKHLPALLRAEKLVKKAARANLLLAVNDRSAKLTRKQISTRLFDLTKQAQARGWSAESLLRDEIRRQKNQLKKAEAKNAKRSSRNRLQA